MDDIHDTLKAIIRNKLLNRGYEPEQPPYGQENAVVFRPFIAKPGIKILIELRGEYLQGILHHGGGMYDTSIQNFGRPYELSNPEEADLEDWLDETLKCIFDRLMVGNARDVEEMLRIQRKKLK